MLSDLPKAAKNLQGWPWTEETNPDIYDKNITYPKISIVTPSYNQGQFIEETIRSILLQNYPNLEYIIIDGGSADQTVEIIKKYEKHLTYWISEPDEGQSHAINKGFEKCTGEIINWINSDDFLLNKALFYIGKYNWKHNTGAIVGRGYKINLTGKKVYSPFPSKLNTQAIIDWPKNNFMQPACFFKHQAFIDVGKLDKNLYGAFDVDLWIKISQKYKFEHLDKNIAHAYHQEDAKTVANKERVSMEAFLLMFKYGQPNLCKKYSFELIDNLTFYKNYYLKQKKKKRIVTFIRKYFKK